MNSVFTESMRSDKKFKYLGKFDFIFQMNLAYVSEDQVGALIIKRQKYCVQVYLSDMYYCVQINTV
jgi:hypothetical protein